jgi:hypothetical protein
VYKIKTRRPQSQATAYYLHNVFTSTLPSSGGREGEAWESCNKTFVFFFFFLFSVFGGNKRLLMKPVESLSLLQGKLL